VIASGTNILEFQIGRIRLNIDDIAFGFIRSRNAFSVRAPQGIHVRQCWIVEGIFINDNAGSSTCSRRSRPKGCFQNKCFLLCFGLKQFTMPTSPTLITHLFLGSIQVQKVRAFGAESHPSIDCWGLGVASKRAVNFHTLQ